MSKPPKAVPFWYHVEYHLLSNPLTRFLLFNWHRVLKKYYTIREQRLARKYPDCLMNFEQRIYSQNGEDGIIREIFRRIGTTDKFFVEFGVQDGHECNTRHLLEDKGWSGVWMEGTPELAERARQVFGRFPITILQRFLTTENIIPAFEEAGVPREFDLLSIDVDGNDYWLWDVVGRHYSPRVVVIEYNSTFGSRRPWIMPYNPGYRHDGTAYAGASLEAFHRRGKELGYRLVGCEHIGVNAFFVRGDLVDSKFLGIDRPTSFHYVAPHCAAWFGNPVREVPERKPRGRWL